MKDKPARNYVTFTLMFYPRTMESVNDQLYCDKCGREYKLRRALEKHQIKCVKVAKRKSLGQAVTESNDGALIKLAADLPELVVKKVRRKSKSMKVGLSEDSGNVNKTAGHGRGKPNPKSILEQADKETKLQLIQCNVNEVLTEAASSQVHLCPITQQMPVSKLSKLATDRRWWATAREPPAMESLQESLWENDLKADKSGGITTNLQNNLIHDQTSTVYEARGSCTSNRSECKNGDSTLAMLQNKLFPGPTAKVKLTRPVDINGQPTDATVSDGSDLVNNPLFSDISIKTNGDVSICAHKILLSIVYPEIQTFLKSHKQINLSSLSPQDVTVWLTAVYARTLGCLKDELSPRALDTISQFIDFSSTWKDSSANHILANNNTKMSKSVSESRTAPSRKKQKSHSNSLLDQKGGVTSQDQPDSQTVTESSAAVDTNMASLVKPQKRLKSKLIDRKGVTPKPSSHMKISPLLSTVGTVTLVKTDSVAMTASTNMLSDMTDSGDAGIHVPIVSTVDQIA
ncbi:uncharacterized protein [Watersipora subatra]|uniref:uncharacterized protein n=1 Tax=Watersipora subatra TaxID=2589382 RepID=UPI00355C75E2